MTTLELEITQLKERLERLEEKVELLAEDRPRRRPVLVPGQPLSEQQLLDWLKAEGQILEPSPMVREHAAQWDALSEEEKQEHIRYMRELVLDPPLSQIVIENRR